MEGASTALVALLLNVGIGKPLELVTSAGDAAAAKANDGALVAVMTGLNPRNGNAVTVVLDAHDGNCNVDFALLVSVVCLNA